MTEFGTGGPVYPGYGTGDTAAVNIVTGEPYSGCSSEVTGGPEVCLPGKAFILAFPLFPCID